MTSSRIADLFGKYSRCTRCGEYYYSDACVHEGNGLVTQHMTDDEAFRVQARYQLGKKYNPDHDTTSYRDKDWGL